MRHKKLVALLMTAAVLAIAAAGVVVFANSPSETDAIGRIADREAFIEALARGDFAEITMRHAAREGRGARGFRNLEGFDRDAWLAQFEGLDLDALVERFDREAWRSQFEGLDREAWRAQFEGFDREAWLAQLEGLDRDALREMRGSVGRRYFRDIGMERFDFPFVLPDTDIDNLIEMRRNMREHIERGDFDFSQKREMIENGNFQEIIDSFWEAAGR